MSEKMGDNQLTVLVNAAAAGDRQAAESLLPLLYDELRDLAKARLNRLAPGQTLQPTALVHEAYLRVIGNDDPGWDNRGHFFGAAAQAMRNILIDQARRKQTRKHGGDRHRVELGDEALPIESPSEDLLELDELLKELEQDDPRKGQIVNLRYFAGLTAQQTAEALGISLGTVEREWRFIRAWLHAKLRGDLPD